MKKFFLHIGFNKTGSTTIQESLLRNSEALVAQGILYPCAPGAPFIQREQHVPLAAAVPGRQVHWVRPEKKATLGRAWESLHELASSSPCQTIVVSSESFGALDVGARKVEWVAEQLTKFDVRVVAYIRRQDAYFLSAYQEGIKEGATKAFDFDGYGSAAGLHFARRLAPWRQVFGADRVIVRPFVPALWPEGELFFDFLDVIGASRVGMNLARPSNEGMDYRMVDLLRRLNQLAPEPGAHERRKAHRAFARAAARLLPPGYSGQKMQLSSEQAETLRRYFRAENEAALEGSGVDPDAFFPPVQPGVMARLAPEGPDVSMLLHLLSALAQERELHRRATRARGSGDRQDRVRASDRLRQAGRQA